MKEFTVNDKTYEVRTPSAQDVQDAQRHYNKVFARGLKDPDTMTQDEMRETLKERGYLSDETEAEIKSYLKELKENLEVLERGGIELEEAEKYAVQAREIREKILEKQLVISAYLSKTVEQQAQDAQEDFLFSKVVFEKGKNKPYCKDLNDYYAKKNDDVMFTAYSYFAGSQQPEDVYAALPEIEFLQEYGFMDENFVLTSEKTEEPEKVEKKPFLLNGKPIEKKKEADETEPQPVESAEA